MKNEFEAYYAKTYAWMFACAALLFLLAIIWVSILWTPGISLPCIIILSIFFGGSVYACIATYRKDGIAVEIAENTFILHKKERIEIPIKDMIRFTIHDGDGSFDISIRTNTKKIAMHCFIKEQRKKKDQLIALLTDKGVKVITYCPEVTD